MILSRRDRSAGSSKEEAARLRAEGGGGGGKVGKGDKNGKGKGGGKSLGKAGGGKPTDGGKGKKRICLQYLRGSCSRAAKDCAFSHDVKQAQRVVNAVYAGAGAVAMVQPAPPAPAPVAEPVGAGGAGVAQVAPVAPTLAKGAGQALIWTRPVGGVFPAGLPQVATCAAVQAPANGI